MPFFYHSKALLFVCPCWSSELMVCVNESKGVKVLEQLSVENQRLNKDREQLCPKQLCPKQLCLNQLCPKQLCPKQLCLKLL